MSSIASVNAHYQAIIDKNLEEILNKYVISEETYVILEGPRLTTIGFEKIKKGWTDFCSSAIELRSIDWIEGPFYEESQDMAWVAGIIQLAVSIGKNQFENTFRASFVLKKQSEKNWQIKHEHVSVVHPDPYGIGDWKK
jgi:ketosteroid isomerase-like protein